MSAIDAAFENAIIANVLARLQAAYPMGCLDGQSIFILHDTYGLPFDFIRETCRDRRAFFDAAGLRLELKYCYGWGAERIAVELRDLVP